MRSSPLETVLHILLQCGFPTGHRSWQKTCLFCGLLSMFMHALIMGCTIFQGISTCCSMGSSVDWSVEISSSKDCGVISALLPAAPPSSTSLTMASVGFFLIFFSLLSHSCCAGFLPFLGYVLAAVPPAPLSDSAVSCGGSDGVGWHWLCLFPQGATPAMPQLTKPCHISQVLCDNLSAWTWPRQVILLIPSNFSNTFMKFFYMVTCNFRNLSSIFSWTAWIIHNFEAFSASAMKSYVLDMKNLADRGESKPMPVTMWEFCLFIIHSLDKDASDGRLASDIKLWNK